MVKIMKRAKNWTVLAAATLGLVACGEAEVEKAGVVNEAEDEAVAASVSPKDASLKDNTEQWDGTFAKPGSPYGISYRIVGTPVVGSPLTIELRVASLHGVRPLLLDYRVRDASSLIFADSQPSSVQMEPAANETDFRQQVTIVPQREGRFYLNVSASYESEDGTASTVTAIPIQVGTGTRELQENGELQLDENGEAIRVLSDK
jgi:hypothetical protein